ncbi:hypothetical protein Lxx01990 [Leifsonia xyli subsp. xyli str. CTCB07]|uniref:Uncharacterized protein n=1 Tax=Leifsonia xyli subsp. xyli (strain CTCB07) TaxID=281090 RepID=Q6AH89_LEIXX|nr:hypothetical protein Lxx01990 [Leifsonia xyli subsp. xyli str. CTCB07]
MNLDDPQVEADSEKANEDSLLYQKICHTLLGTDLFQP